jgi:hypothetical protein
MLRYDIRQRLVRQFLRNCDSADREKENAMDYGDADIPAFV